MTYWCPMTLLVSMLWLLLLLLCNPPCFQASLQLYDPDGGQLSSSLKLSIQDSFRELLSDIQPDITYYAGSGFTSPVETNPSHAAFIFFYPRVLCGSKLTSWVRSSSGKNLQANINATLLQLSDFMDNSYRSGYVVRGQVLVGYYTNPNSWKAQHPDCPHLTNRIVDDGIGFCNGFEGILMANTPFQSLSAGCPLQTPDKKFTLVMKNPDCKVAVTDNSSNNTIWSQGPPTKQDSCFFILQNDWHLILYDSTNSLMWMTEVYVHNPQSQALGVIWLLLGSNGILTIYLSGKGGAQSIWHSDDSKRPSIDSENILGSSAVQVENPPPSTQVKTCNSSKFKVLSFVLAAAIVALMFGVIFLLAAILRQRRHINFHKNEPKDFASSKLQRYTFSSLSAATQDFHVANKLGQGGSAIVYKGVLQTTGEVAIKFLQKKNQTVSDDEFINEVSTLSYLQHRSLIKLNGFCCEGNHRLLVYEFLENNSLAEALLTGPNKLYIPWAKRYDICVGVARGLAYLHEESRTRIVHRDIKGSNILLDKELNARVADFGLARLLKDGDTHLSTRVAGTFGYLAPEYALQGKLTEKADVYSFGILQLELLSGRSSIDFSLPPEEAFLLEWTWELYEKGKWLELIDEKLVPDSCPRGELERVLLVSLICTQGAPWARPAMSRVVAMLVGDVIPTLDITRPGFLPDLKQAALKTE